MGRTRIEWTEETWNPVTGCTKVSEGCRNCYAERMARRLAGRFGYPEAPHHFDVTLHRDRLEDPLRWRKPRLVFVPSMGDLFHEEVPFGFLREVFEVMREAPQHTYQVLTKRPERMIDFVWWLGAEYHWPLANVWGMVSAENQEEADRRVPLLLKVPFAVHGVSLEPLLGAVDIQPYLPLTPLHLWTKFGEAQAQRWLAERDWLDWVIVGGESGPGARPMKPGWARGVRDQCQAAGVAFFMKQMSKRAPIPDDLMIREYPDAKP